jgi:hypothetical protein
MALTDMKGNDASGSTSLLPLFHRWITIYQHRISRYQSSTIAELITAQQIFFHFPKTKRARAQQSTALKYTAGRGQQYRVSIGGHRVFQANVCRNPDELTNPEGQDRHSTGADLNREGENTAVGFYFPSPGGHLFKIFVQSPLNIYLLLVLKVQAFHFISVPKALRVTCIKRQTTVPLSATYLRYFLNRERSHTATMGNEEDSLSRKSESGEDGYVENIPASAPDFNKDIPNGGLTAWLQVLGSFFLFFNTWFVPHFSSQPLTFTPPDRKKGES